MGLQSNISHQVLRAGLRLLLSLTWMVGVAAHSQSVSATTPLFLPTNVAVDGSGNLYIAETGRHRVWKIDGSGRLINVAGTGTQGFSGDGGAASAALLDSPQGLAVGGGKLYIADSHNHRVRRVDLASGAITTVVGSASTGSSGDGGRAADATLDHPIALALGSQGELYIVDERSHRIRRIAIDGVITTLVGTGVQGFDGDGDSAAAALFDSPGGIAVDASGNLFVADTHNQRLRRVDGTTGKVTTLAGTGGAGFSGDSGPSTAARLALPRGVSVDQQGDVYIADAANHRLRRIDAGTGVITTLAGDGTQSFSGDDGPPANASLNSPGGVAVGSSGIMIADTGNNRIRQVAGATTIETISGAGAKAASAVMITGAGSVIYGSGQINIQVGSADASGTIRVTDSDGSSVRELGVIPLTSQSVSVDLSSLPAGSHSIIANYSGDATHTTANSAAFALSVNPLAVTATVSPPMFVYGTSVPQLSGTLNGVLAQDVSKVSARFSADVGSMSEAGSYPVSVQLDGEAAANYSIRAVPLLTIAQATTATTMAVTAATLVNGNTVAAGQSVLISAHVAGSTSGAPSGVVTILDGAKILGMAPVGSSGDFAITTSSLAEGTHSLSASYAGDRNFRGSSSSAKSITVGTPGGGAERDFTMTAAGAVSANIIAGGNATFTFSVTPQAALTSKVALAASGLPALATASFNPASVPPGSTATVTLTISTQRAQLRNQGSLMLAGITLPLTMIFQRRRSWRYLVCSLSLAALTGMLCGCGDRVFSGNPSATAAKTYNVTVTGTATEASGGAIQHAVSFTLTVLPNS